MKRIDLVFAASSAHSSWFVGAWRAGGQTGSASGVPAEYLYFSSDPDAAPAVRVPARHHTVAEIVERFSRDPKRRRAIEQGRRWLAKVLSKDEGKTVRTLRLGKGWSHERLASELGTSVYHVVAIERGKAELSLDTCRRLCSALDVDMNALDAALHRRGA